MQKILTPHQMRQAETYSEKQGVSLWDLMLNAGNQLADIVFVRAKQLEARSVLILCGRGNNGGDGYVCAAKLASADADLEVAVCALAGDPKTDLSKKAYELAKKDKNIEFYSELSEKPIKADIIVDCVFGTGFHGDLDKSRRREFAMLSAVKAYKIACDLPSGVDSLRGCVADGTCAFDETVTFHAPKLGMVLKPARAYCGRITVCDIGIPGSGLELSEDKTMIREAEAEDLHKLIPPRPDYSHKGTFGRLLIILRDSKPRGAHERDTGDSGYGSRMRIYPSSARRRRVYRQGRSAYTRRADKDPRRYCRRLRAWSDRGHEKAHKRADKKIGKAARNRRGRNKSAREEYRCAEGQEL